MKTVLLHRLAIAAAALACAPAFAQYSSANAISRVNGNTAVVGTTVDSTVGAPTETSAAALRSDQILLASVVNALVSDARMNGAQVEVQVSEGRVTLGGIVRDGDQSQAARAIADGIAGSANVTSKLTTGG